MDKTYTQIHVQVVFAVEGRQNLIRPEFRKEVQKYMAGIIHKRSQKLLAIYCMPDHTHLLIGLRPEMALSDLVNTIKTGSADLVNRKSWFAGRFGWQDGFGAFSYGHSQVSTVIQYIRNQPRHHAKLTFKEEYLRFLERFELIKRRSVRVEPGRMDDK
jgi:REP element-mobilizing transposase RayT